MTLGSWLRALSSNFWNGSTPGNGYLLDERAFRYEAVREQARVVRSGSSLAVLVIELPPGRSSPADFAFLGWVIAGRLRITDTAGLLSDGRVGVLLPNTSESGAWKVASDICEVYPVGHDRPNCEVYVYPEDDVPSDDDTPEREQPVDAPVASAFESLFLHPTPTLKRAIDVLGASVGLVVTAPLMLIFAAIIKLSSPGPVIFSQEREGIGGRRFRIHKLRTMRHDAARHQAALRQFSDQDGPAFKMLDDPRTTWIGRWLRRTSLDELPQLWNVLVGDMSLVGPRPLPTEESLQCAPWQRQRLAVVPGLTCLWQVSGRNTVSFEQWMRMDLEYLRRRSFGFDVLLLLRTVPSLLFHRGPR